MREGDHELQEKKNLPAFCLFFIVFGPMLLVRKADSRLLTGVVVGSDEDTLHPLALPPLTFR